MAGIGSGLAVLALAAATQAGPPKVTTPVMIDRNLQVTPAMLGQVAVTAYVAKGFKLRINGTPCVETPQPQSICKRQVPRDSEVTFEIAYGPEMLFNGWELNACGKALFCKMTAHGDLSVGNLGHKRREVTVDVAVERSGVVTGKASNGATIECHGRLSGANTGTCKLTALEGASVVLTASDNEGPFNFWASGFPSGCVQTAKVCSFPLWQNTRATAVFSLGAGSK